MCVCVCDPLTTAINHCPHHRRRYPNHSRGAQSAVPCHVSPSTTACRSRCWPCLCYFAKNKHIHTHTHTHTQRERERERQTDRDRERETERKKRMKRIWCWNAVVCIIRHSEEDSSLSLCSVRLAAADTRLRGSIRTPHTTRRNPADR